MYINKFTFEPHCQSQTCWWDHPLSKERRAGEAHCQWHHTVSYHFMKNRCLDSCSFAVHVTCVTSAGMADMSCQQGLTQAVYFCPSTTRGVCEALFQYAALGLAPEMGWGVVPHWLLSVCGISSDVLWQFSSTTRHICLQSVPAFHLCYP